MAPIEVIYQSLRDGQQSYWGMRMRAGQIIPVAPLIDSADYRVVDRNFYGVLRVSDTPESEDEGGMRQLYHGSITHGAEFMSPERRRSPTTGAPARR